MFEWLKRWPECGSPCQRCANECPVQAIHPEGQINVNECIYCMHCQELYHGDTRCPHMIQVRVRREKAAQMSVSQALEGEHPCPTRTTSPGLNRRQLLGTSAALAAGAPAIGGLGLFGAAPARAQEAAGSAHVAPGELDEYYVFTSGGQSGEIRIVGLPSMRELMRIPVFNRDSATGWGQTNESRRVLTEGLTPETRRVPVRQGRGLHERRPAPPAPVVHRRHLRRPLPLLQRQGQHPRRPHPPRRDARATRSSSCRTSTPCTACGCRSSRAPATSSPTARTACRCRTTARSSTIPTQYHSIFSAIDGDTMEVAWQIKVDGNLDNVDADYQGKYCFATCYNSENGVTLADMMANDEDWVVIFNLKRIEEAVAAGKAEIINGVPVLDGRHGSPYTRYIPVANSPHGINTAPDGIHVVANGKLSPTVTVFDVRLFDDLFDDKIQPRDTVVAEPELGLGPLHTAYDGKGNAYTTLFLDSQVCKWNIEDAKRAFKGEQVDPIRQKLDVHYQPGHNHTSMGQTKEADGKWLISLNKFSKDRFLNVGPLKPECDQLIDISGDEMVIVHDNPTFAEPHDATIVHASKINPVSIWDRDDPFFAETVKMAEADGIDPTVAADVIRDGDKVRVYMFSAAPAFSLDSFTVKQGDEVTVVITNIDEVEDLTHGFSIINYGINFEIAPQATASVTFKADKPGVYWYYCSWFCHAMHMEMKGRMLVEPAGA